MFCRSCGNKIDNGHKWCSHCGEAVLNSNNKVNSQTTQNRSLNLNNKNKSMIIIVIISIVGLLLISNKAQSPEKVAEKFTKSIFSGKFQEALEYTNADEVLPPRNYAELLMEAQQEENDFDFKKSLEYNFKTAKLNKKIGNKAFVSITVNKGTSPDTQIFTLKKSNGKWKIDVLGRAI